MTGRPDAALTVIGSGTLYPSALRSSSSYHLAIEDGPSLLIDCGWGTLHALARRGIDWERIDALAVTHYHGDHVGDLPALVAAWRQRGRTRPLTLLGPDNLAAHLEALAGAFGPWLLEPGFPMSVVALGPSGSWDDAGGTCRIEAVRTPHTEESIALRASGRWGVVGYTGDTAPSAAVAAFMKECDVLVAECALPEPAPFEGHLTPASLAEMANVARPGLLLATHVYPPLAPEAAVAAVREAYPGPAEAAADGMVLSWTDGIVAVDRPAGRE